MRRALLALLAAFVASPAPGAAPRDPNHVYVAAGSDAIREILASEAGSDPHRLMVAREMLNLGGEDRAVKALDDLLAALALLELQGKPPPASRTIRQLVDAPQADAASNAPGIKALLETSLQGRSAGIGPEELRVDIANRTNATIHQFDVHLFLKGSDDLMTCRAPGRPGDLAPGQEARYHCEPFGNRYGIQERLRKFEAEHPPGAAVKIQASRINFREPRISVTSRGILRLDDGRAFAEATATLRAMDCERRGACLEELKRKAYAKPHYLVAAGGAGAGLLAGILIGMFGVRRGRAAGIASTLALGVAAAGLAIMGSHVGAGNSLALIILGALALLAVGAFLVAMWITVAVIGMFSARGEPPDSSGSSE